MRKIVIIAELLAVLIASILMFPQVTKTFTTLNADDWKILAHRREWVVFRESSLPRSGEFVLPGEVQVMVGMLRAMRVDSFRFSGEIAKQGEIMRRLVEGAYPIRVSESSPYLVLFEREPLPAGCSLVALQEGVGLAYCR